MTQNERIKKLESYLEYAGYVRVEVKAGDSLKGNTQYFKSLLESRERGVSGTIKEIIIHPYKLEYLDENNEKNTVIAKGQCLKYV